MKTKELIAEAKAYLNQGAGDEQTTRALAVRLLRSLERHCEEVDAATGATSADGHAEVIQKKRRHPTHEP